jgi:hypothetical protein
LTREGEINTVEKGRNHRLRSFGLLVGGVFAIIALWPMICKHADARSWALAASAVLILPALLAPRLLMPIYHVWMAVGRGLGWINTRIILGIIYYLTFTPISLLMRISNKDPLRRNFEPASASYRLLRNGRQGSHMNHQF